MLLLSACAPISDRVIFNNSVEQAALPKEKRKAGTAAGKELLIDDFSRKGKNSLGGAVNPWAYNPKDRSQGCRTRVNKEIRINEKGSSLQIIYDVDSPSQAFNGVYWELKEADLSAYSGLSFFIRGDAAKGFTSVLKLELKNNNGQTGVYMLQGITEAWQKVVIPFDDFSGITDFTSMKEFTFVFVDSEVTLKEGVLFVDDLFAVK